MIDLILLATPLLLLLDAMMTRALIRDSSLSPAKRVFQILFVWLVPFVGAIVVYLVLAHHHTRDEMLALLPFPFYLVHREPIAPTRST